MSDARGQGYFAKKMATGKVVGVRAPFSRYVKVGLPGRFETTCRDVFVNPRNAAVQDVA